MFFFMLDNGLGLAWDAIAPDVRGVVEGTWSWRWGACHVLPCLPSWAASRIIHLHLKPNGQAMQWASIMNLAEAVNSANRTRQDEYEDD